MKFEIKKGVFFKTLNLVNENKKSLLYIITLDVIFFVALFILGQIFNAMSYSVSLRQQIYQLLFLVIVYYLVVLFIYSLFKYLVLFFVKSTFKKYKLDFDRLGKFYMLNIILFLILFLIFFILSIIAASINEGIAPFISLGILLLYIVFAYAFVNINHVLFYEGKGLIATLQSGTKFLGKFTSYYGVYIVILAAFGIIALLFSIFGTALKNTLFQDYNALLQYGDVYTIVFVHAVGIIFYLAILFNRFYFYGIVKEKFKD